MENMSRASFIKMGMFAGAAFSIMPSKVIFGGNSGKLRLGIIGTGLRGQELLRLCLQRSDTLVPAICDVDERMIADALSLYEKANQPLPEIYRDSVYVYRELLNRSDIDAVLIATPWEWHFSMAMEALDAGKNVGCEVIMALTVDEHWQIVQKVEQTGLQYMMLENVCYRRDVMAIMNMVRKGVFGELIHMQAGYQHDLREVKFNNGQQPYGGGVEFGPNAFSEARWRTQHSVDRNGDLYPTHGIGPVSKILDIHCGNRFTQLVSYASKARGLNNYVVDHGGVEHPNAKVHFKLGDVVTTMIETSNGETVLLQHDTNLPRPYSLGFRVQGTKGLWMDVNDSLYIEGKSKPHRWEDAQKWLDEYDHPLWKRFAADAEGAGHGGMDFFAVNAFIEALKAGAPTPIDVYDSAAWSVISPLSERSIAEGGSSLPFPDFTSGKWQSRQQFFALDDQY